MGFIESVTSRFFFDTAGVEVGKRGGKTLENRVDATNGQVYGDESDPRVVREATNGNDSRLEREKLATLVTTSPHQRSRYSVNDLTTLPVRALNFKSVPSVDADPSQFPIVGDQWSNSSIALDNPSLTILSQW